MSAYFMEHGKIEVRKFDKGLTKQTFRDETDINKILQKFQVSGVVSHLNKFEGMYGEFADFDFLNANLMLNKGADIFAALPSEVRREFDQDPSKFFAFVNDVENKDKLNELLPGIAVPGDYFVDVSSDTPPGELLQGGEPGGRRADDIRDVGSAEPGPEVEPVGDTGSKSG